MLLAALSIYFRQMIGPFNGMSKLTLLAKQNTYQRYLVPVRSVYAVNVLSLTFWAIIGIRQDHLIHPL